MTHYAWQRAERLNYFFPFWIDMAVPVFMIISGFVYAKSFQKNRIHTLEAAYTVKNCLGKVIRYSIPFMIIFIIEEIVYGFQGMESHSILQMVISFLSGGFGPGSYYYPVMMQFIFYFPIIFIIVYKYEFNGLLLCAFLNVLYEILKHSYEMNIECYRLLIFRYTLLIAYGCYLAMRSYKRHMKLSIVCFIAGVSYIVIVCYMGVTPPITGFWSGTCIWACLYIIPISAPVILNKLKNRFIEVMGKASYNIFLVQMVYYNSAGDFYKNIENRGLQLLVNVIICVVLGLVFYYAVTPVTKIATDKAYRIWGNLRK